MSLSTPHPPLTSLHNVLLRLLLLYSSLQLNGQGGGAWGAGLPLPDAPGLVRRAGSTLEECAKACLDEKTIKCRYFKLVPVSHVCLLSALSQPAAADPSPQAHQGSDADFLSPGAVPLHQTSSWDTADQAARADMLSRALADLKQERELASRATQRETHELQRALVELRARLDRTAESAERTHSDLASLRDQQSRLSSDVASVRRAQGDLVSKMNEMERRSASFGSDVNAIRHMEEDVGKELRELREGIAEEEKREEQLEQSVQTMAHKDNSEVDDRMERLQKNQRLMARILEAVAKDTSLMDRHLARQDQGLEGLASNVASKLSQQREVQGAVRDVDKEIREIRADIDRLIDPRSPINMDRSKGLLKMRNDIVSLAEALRRTQMDLKSQKVDMMSLVKDLANVQLAAQDTKAHLYTVIKALTHLRDDVNEIKKLQLQKPSVVQVAEMHKRVLVALRGLETKEDNLLDKVAEYKMLVENLAKRFQQYRTGGPEVFSLLKEFQDKMQHTEHRVDRLASLMRHLEVTSVSEPLASVPQLKEDEERLKEKIHHIDEKIQTLKTSIHDIKENQQEVASKAQEAETQMAREQQRHLINLQTLQEKGLQREEKMQEKLDQVKAETEQLRSKARQAMEQASTQQEALAMGGEDSQEQPDLRVRLNTSGDVLQGQLQQRNSTSSDEQRNRTLADWERKWGGQAEALKAKSQSWEDTARSWEEQAEQLKGQDVDSQRNTDNEATVREETNELTNTLTNS